MSYKELPSGKYISESPPCRAGCEQSLRAGAHAEGNLAPEGAWKGKSRVGSAQRKAVVMQAQPG